METAIETAIVFGVENGGVGADCVAHFGQRLLHDIAINRLSEISGIQVSADKVQGDVVLAGKVEGFFDPCGLTSGRTADGISAVDRFDSGHSHLIQLEILCLICIPGHSLW